MTTPPPLARRSATRRIFVLLQKELVQLVRDRAIFLCICYVFTLNIVFHAAGTSFELKRESLLVRDSDHSALSRELVARLRAPYFRSVGTPGPTSNIDTALDRGEAELVIDLPPGLAARVTAAREPADMQAIVDSSRVLTGFLASSYATRITELFNEEIAAERLPRLGIDPKTLPRVENEIRTAYNLAGDDRWPMSIAMLFTMMTFACVLLPASAVVREKEHGTAEQLLVSPLTPLEILVPKALSMVLVSTLGAGISVLGVLGPGLGVPCRGSLALFLVLTGVYAFTNAGLGLLLGTLARTSAQVGLMIIMIILPIVQLSGTWTSVESMPVLLRHAILVSPLYHYAVIGNGILLKGVGLGVLWPHAAAMLAIGVVLFGFSLLQYRRKLTLG
jgi:ABC-2 type transport system permease protein